MRSPWEVLRTSSLSSSTEWVKSNWSMTSLVTVVTLIATNKLANHKAGGVPYGGKIYTDADSAAGLGEWGTKIYDVPTNVDTVSFRYDQGPLLNTLTDDFAIAMDFICEQEPTKGFEAWPAKDYAGTTVDITDEGKKLIVIDVPADKMTVDKPLYVVADPEAIVLFRWGLIKGNPQDNRCIYTNKVEINNGGGIIPVGFTVDRLIHAAGNLDTSGSGVTPVGLPKFPMWGPLNDESPVPGCEPDWNGGGYFVGYWFTTGKDKVGGDNNDTDGLDGAVFIGGWFSTSKKITIKGGGIHVKLSYANGADDDFAVSVKCNNVDELNACFEDEKDLRFVAVRNIVEALVISIGEGNGPGEVQTRNLRGQTERSLTSCSFCGSPSMCVLYSWCKRRLVEEIASVSENFGDDYEAAKRHLSAVHKEELEEHNRRLQVDSTEILYPVVKEHHSLQTLLDHYQFPTTDVQKSCIAESYCQLTYAMMQTATTP